MGVQIFKSGDLVLNVKLLALNVKLIDTSMKLQVSFLFALVLLAGCQEKSQLQRTIVSGQVTYQGKPVERGRLRFVPIEGTKGPPAGAVIEGGSYTVKALGGVSVGTARVEIKAYREIGPPPDPQSPASAMHVRPGKQYLPEKYNKKSELKVTIESGQQTRDFHLE